jgi:ribosomal protein S18 acetylase RimI-like enzyme
MGWVNRSDFETVFAMHREAFRAHIERIWGTWDENWQRDNFRRECSESMCEVIVVDDSPAGFIQRVEESDCISVWNVALRSEFRGRGIGTALVQELQERARERGVELRLRVFPANERAQRFYMRLGFRETSRNRTGIDLACRSFYSRASSSASTSHSRRPSASGVRYCSQPITA